MRDIFKKPHNNKGVALVLVLWLLALLTIMTMGYSATMRTESRLTAHEVGSARARALSQGGIWYGVHELLRHKPEQAWRRNGTPHSIQYGEGEMEIRLYDESGKIDLNTARTELLLGLLIITAVDDDISQQVVDAIEDWRDKDNLKRASGAEDDDYINAGLNYGAKDGPFNSVGELRQVIGMTEQIFKQIAPALTVNSHRTAINPESAPPLALLAMPNSDPAEIEAFIRDRESNSTDESTTLPSNSRFLTTASGNIFTIASTGKSDAIQYTTEAVILVKQNAQMPFSVLSWSEAVSGGN